MMVRDAEEPTVPSIEQVPSDDEGECNQAKHARKASIGASLSLQLQLLSRGAASGSSGGVLHSLFAVPAFARQAARSLAARRDSPDKEPEAPFLPPQRPEDMGKKTLVLDLDETLIASAPSPIENPDFTIAVKVDSGPRRPVYVRTRPHLDTFLRTLAPHFEIVLFTASVPEYANPVVNRIDPCGAIRYRLFRGHCKLFNGGFIKDLSKLGRPLEDVILLDNSPVAYTYQPLNGVPCTTWYSRTDDKELLELIPLFLRVKNAEDVRVALGVAWEDVIFPLRGD